MQEEIRQLKHTLHLERQTNIRRQEVQEAQIKLATDKIKFYEQQEKNASACSNCLHKDLAAAEMEASLLAANNQLAQSVSELELVSTRATSLEQHVQTLTGHLNLVNTAHEAMVTNMNEDLEVVVENAVSPFDVFYLCYSCSKTMRRAGY
uniref:t-SNARE coiled-coil homology domain-containing protein n=1 Tax=Panagrellus redivivus TaxID=6233 RepID=A0A7E4WBV8_PANRE